MYEGAVFCHESEFGDGSHDVSVEALEPSERVVELESIWALDEEVLVFGELHDEDDGAEMTCDVWVAVCLAESFFNL